MIEQKRNIIIALEKIDWNFPGSGTLQNTVHSLHWFPGNFIPQIPSYLIQILSNDGDMVLDPFCGSGTTGIEATRLGRQCIQADNNRISVQVSYGKIAAYTNANVKQNLIRISNDLVYDPSFVTNARRQTTFGTHPELAKWFNKNTYDQLKKIWYLIEIVKERGARKVLEMIFSDTLFACASTSGSITSKGGRRRHHWGWVSDNVIPSNPVQHDAYKLFCDRLHHAIDVVSLNSKLPDNKNLVIRCDARKLALCDSSVDLVVTSPPYISMIDYTLANRLQYYWMNWPINEDKEIEIGARVRRQNKSAISQYISSMTIASREVKRVLRPGGYCAIVIGASRKYPFVAQDVISIFDQDLTKIWGPKVRETSRRRIAEQKGTNVPEYICVFQNQK